MSIIQVSRGGALRDDLPGGRLLFLNLVVMKQTDRLTGRKALVAAPMGRLAGRG